MKLRKEREIEEMNKWALERLGQLDNQAFLAAGAALYAGEGRKGGGEVCFANTNPEIMRLFMRWLRTFFDIDESRLRVRLYLHEELDVDESNEFWSDVLGIPLSQFPPTQLVKSRGDYRQSKHIRGCASVRYCDAQTHRRIMGLMKALLSSAALPG